MAFCWLFEVSFGLSIVLGPRAKPGRVERSARASSRGRAGTWPERRRLDADPAARRRAPAPKPLPVLDAPCSTPKMKRESSGGSRLLAWVLWLQAWRVAAPCPAACVCYNEPKVTTSCPQQGLQAVPTGIPASSQRIFLHGNHRCGLQELGPGLFRGLVALQYLYLQDNNLQALPDNAFRDLGNLTHLFLHGNRIPSVPEHAFRGLHSLDRLLLHQNHVTRVHPHAFQDLGRLMTLYLFANNISMLPAEVLVPLRSLQYLRLNDNPWICDCRARPLWAWLKKFRGSSSEVPCSLPARLAGRDLKRLATSDLEGCVVASGPFRPFQTTQLTDEELLGLPKCCQPDAADKASVLEPGRPASAGNALKGRVPPGDTPPGNGSGPRHINDSPFGTLPSSAEPPLTALQPGGSEAPELPTTGPRRRPGCSRKNRTRSHCRLGQAGSGSSGGGEAEGSGALPALACSLAPLGLALPEPGTGSVGQARPSLTDASPPAHPHLHPIMFTGFRGWRLFQNAASHPDRENDQAEDGSKEAQDHVRAVCAFILLPRVTALMPGCLTPRIYVPMNRRQELREIEEKSAGTGGGNWGSQMATGAARDPETRGGGWDGENVLSSHHLRRDGAKETSSDTLLALSDLAEVALGAACKKTAAMGTLQHPGKLLACTRGQVSSSTPPIPKDLLPV
ncbi:reticulon-4 receptor [Sigmodon hispidus]